MRLNRVVPVLMLAVGVGACDESLLDLRPVDQIDTESAIIDGESAQAALNGAYEAFQDLWYIGGDYYMFGDLMTTNAEHTGTFAVYADADAVSLTSDNDVIDQAWAAAYEGINRVNLLIEKVPELLAAEAIDTAVAEEILGESYALRAAHYHNLVKAWENVPLVLVSPQNPDEASAVTQATPAQTYTQIHADLDQAESLMVSAGMSNDVRTFATPGFTDALRARVYLYQDDWASAEAAALEVVNSGDYALVANYADLFEPDGAPTSEDIFRVVFNATTYNNFGYYYQFDGRFELGATQNAFDAFDAANDERHAWTFGEVRTDGIEVTKFPTTVGSENIHFIRYAEVLLILAEAHARQGELAQAVARLNEVHTRAGLLSYDLVLDFANDQQQVLDAIFEERRLELMYEGDWWFDLARRGVLPPGADAVGELLWPIPLGELDTAPSLVQNEFYR